ncbi:hypothetical protein VTN00DRAFT_2887 [Thermoascus crustaceus]|uniref:uncharacterized protein n=1 Tax=Thermoascus crustaceus TaxID=5088 RepID=UPI00374312A5
MDRRKETGLSAPPDESDARSLISMQELEPSPVEEAPPDLKSGAYFPKREVDPSSEQGGFAGKFSFLSLGLSGHRWDYWLSTLQKYSTYPPTLFFVLHIANTSLIPLATRTVPASEPYLLLTRPIYQAPSLEHVVLTVPIITHVVSGITLRSIRGRRRARLYGAETRAQRYLLKSWPKPSVQARLGYALLPLLGVHVLVNRLVPLAVEGGSSGVGLGYVAHGFARSPAFWNLYYIVFVAAGVWHIVGGWATWMGWRVTTARHTRGESGSIHGGYLGYMESPEQTKRKNRMWRIVHGIAAVGTAIWLAGALGVVGRGGPGSGWEAKNWDALYRSVPVISGWL